MLVQTARSQFDSYNFKAIMFERRFWNRLPNGGITIFQEFVIAGATLATTILSGLVTLLCSVFISSTLVWPGVFVATVGTVFMFFRSFHWCRHLDEEIRDLKVDMTQWQYVQYRWRRKHRRGVWINGVLRTKPRPSTTVDLSACNTNQLKGGIVMDLVRQLDQRPRHNKPAKRPFDDMDGCFVLSKYITEACFVVPLMPAYDQATPEMIEAWHRTTSELIAKLDIAESFRLEVMPLPITKAERLKMILEAEARTTGFPSQNPVWHRQADRQASILEGDGDWAPCGVIFLNFGSRKQLPPYKGTRMAFRATPLAKRMYVTQFENARLVEPAARALVELSGILPGIMPAEPDAFDRILMCMANPGHNIFDKPWPGGNAHKPRRLRHLTLSHWDDNEDEFLRVVYNGRVTYVVCLPLDLPDFRIFQANAFHEFGFVAWGGVRVRFSYTGRILRGDEALKEAGHKVKDILDHYESHVASGGDPDEMKEKIARAKEQLEHLRKGGCVVMGRPMLIAAADNPDDLARLRADITSEINRGDVHVIRDIMAQRDLLWASLPGTPRLELHESPVGPDLAAQAAMFTTSGVPMYGPDFIGYVMGKERLAVFGGYDAPLWLGNTQAPSWMIDGGAGRGKTSTTADGLLAVHLRDRKAVIVFVDLAKGDMAKLRRNRLSPDVNLTILLLEKLPGCLNPVALTPWDFSQNARQDVHRITAMKRHVIKMLGNLWKPDKDWDIQLQRACSYVLRTAYEQAGAVTPQEKAKVIPNLFNIEHRLYDQEHYDLAAVVSDTFSAPGAAISLSNEYAHRINQLLSIPGVYVAKCDAITVPKEGTPPKDYTPAHNVAIATMGLMEALLYKVAYNENIKLLAAYIEAAVTLKLGVGKDNAVSLARYGRAKSYVRISDSQLLTAGDAPQELLDQNTGWMLFVPANSRLLAPTLEAAGIEATRQRLANFGDLINRKWVRNDPTASINRGAFFYLPPVPDAQPVAVKCTLPNVGDALPTDRKVNSKKAQRQDRKDALRESGIDPKRKREVKNAPAGSAGQDGEPAALTKGSAPALTASHS